MNEQKPEPAADTLYEGAPIQAFTSKGVPITPQMAASRKGRPNRTFTEEATEAKPSTGPFPGPTNLPQRQ